MHTDVIHHVAELSEGIPAGNAHQKLIWTACVLVLGEKLHVASLNLVTVALFIRFLAAHSPLLRRLFVVVLFIVMEAIHSFSYGIITGNIHILASLDE